MVCEKLKSFFSFFSRFFPDRLPSKSGYYYLSYIYIRAHGSLAGLDCVLLLSVDIIHNVFCVDITCTIYWPGDAYRKRRN